jgi:hypothetical protein
VTDDNFKPIFNLSTSTNDSWVYAEFGEDDVPTRAAAWVSEIINDPRPFKDTQSLFAFDVGGASPWTLVGFDNALYLGDSPADTFGPPAIGTGEMRWKLGNVCGITNALFSNITGTPSSEVAAGSQAKMQSSEDGVTWVSEANINVGASPVNQALDAGGADKWVAAWSWVNVVNGNSSGNAQSASVNVPDATLTLYATLTPDTTVQAEETAYQFSATLTNSTIGKALLIDFISDLDETLEIDTRNGAVVYLLDGTSQQQAVRQQDGAKREWFELRDGDNSIDWDDVGTNDVDFQFLWERRYWE